MSAISSLLQCYLYLLFYYVIEMFYLSVGGALFGWVHALSFLIFLIYFFNLCVGFYSSFPVASALKILIFTHRPFPFLYPHTHGHWITIFLNTNLKTLIHHFIFIVRWLINLISYRVGQLKRKTLLLRLEVRDFWLRIERYQRS